MERTLIKRKPPVGIDECWVLDHYADHGGRTELADLFTDAKYRHPAGAARLGTQLARAVRDCAPDTSLLKRADRVVALPSRRALARRLAVAVASELGLASPDVRGLSWNRPVESMKQIPIGERPSHVAGAMTAAPIRGGTVVLVDDLMQSLATFTEAGRAVRHAGAEHVVCLALVVIDGGR